MLPKPKIIDLRFVLLLFICLLLFMVIYNFLNTKIIMDFMEEFTIGETKIHKFSDKGLGKSNTYQVISSNGIFQIDAGYGPTGLKKPDVIILTHAHYDHVFYVNQYSNVEVWASEKTAEHVRNMDETVIVFQDQIGKIKVDKILKEGDLIKMGDFEFEVMETPGHSDGSICLYDETNKFLFSGDVWFGEDIVGRTDLPSSNHTVFQKTLERVRSLDVDQLFPGHDL